MYLIEKLLAFGALFPFSFAALIANRESGVESALLQRIAHGDESALVELYGRYARLLFAILLRVVKNRETAEDLLQELFLQIWSNASSFNASKGNAYSWLVTMARNRAIDRTRSKSFRSSRQETGDLDLDLMLHESGLTPLDALVAAELADLVRNALTRLTPEQREAIELAYYEGYSQSEIAERLNIPLGTAKTRMRQGMIKLHQIIMSGVSRI